MVTTTETIVPHLRPGCLVSTTYPGTTDEIVRPILEKSGPKIGRELFIAYSPEREDPGNPLDARRITKVCSGLTDECLELARKFYKTVVDEIASVSSTRAAELTNFWKTFIGLDIWKSSGQRRQSRMDLSPIIPDRALAVTASRSTPFTSHGRLENLAFIRALSNLPGKLTVRETLAGEIIEMLLKLGADVSYSDPYIPRFPRMRRHSLELASRKLSPQMLAEFDCAVLIADHDALTTN